MKLKLVLFILALMLVLGAGAANAEIPQPNLEILPGGSLDVTGESTVFFDVVFNPMGPVSLGTVTYNIYYDDTELTWNSGLTETYAPSPLFPQYVGLLNGATSGFISNFNAANFGEDANLSDSFLFAHIAFDVASPVLDGSPDVWFDTSTDFDTGFTINGSFVPMSQMLIVGQSPDVAVVPEPVSSALFIVGAVTLGFRRFSRSDPARSRNDLQ